MYVCCYVYIYFYSKNDANVTGTCRVLVACTRPTCTPHASCRPTVSARTYTCTHTYIHINYGRLSLLYTYSVSLALASHVRSPITQRRPRVTRCTTADMDASRLERRRLDELRAMGGNDSVRSAFMLRSFTLPRSRLCSRDALGAVLVRFSVGKRDCD